MTPEERCLHIEKMLRVRRMELGGATDGEKAAATEALNRLLDADGAPDKDRARQELDELQAKFDRAPPGARLRPAPPPPPIVQWIFVQQPIWQHTGTSTTTTWSTTSW